ncbi:Response regulator of zinc sigma-54-dependent two-component system [Labilithrix luteola]|uniref:Response regulator of zinc sigma-54-dependent two-component system n=1 Tax=Labilithrix luteola TaxID=1391654 RepID=A0A0K1PYH5_9BACT|nr:Response regulator of zinc sigma-54-dependent two-component system [Labilithrix luteola]
MLVVDDDAATAEVLRSGVSLMPACACEIALSGPEGIKALSRESFDVVVSDVRMPGMSGFELLEFVRRGDPTLPVILVTANGEMQEAVEAAKQGAFDYMVKPVDFEHLSTTIQRAVGERDIGERDVVERDEPLVTRERAVAQRPSTRVLLGNAPSIVAMLGAIERMALSTAPVLVAGETGTGKDLVASLIHEKGPRRHRPYVAVNTTAIPATLLESELFGHVRGAFTGATQARRGLVVEAEGGTLFLDEIGDMPLELQGTLLRVIETGEVRAVGSDRGRRVDVRFIAATHRDLPSLVRKGAFREDLYYRLNVLSLSVPPLRDRRGDIPLLASHFLEVARSRMPASQVSSISADAKELLSRASWPGNVRQLAATIERIVVLGRSSRIEAADLAFLDQAEAEGGEWPGGSFELCTLKTLTERYVSWVLAQANQDKARAAAILGVDISTLYRWQRRGPTVAGDNEPRSVRRPP